MADENTKRIAELAAGNRIDLEAVQRVSKQMEELQRAGIAPSSSWTSAAPIAAGAVQQRRQTFANARP